MMVKMMANRSVPIWSLRRPATLALCGVLALACLPAQAESLRSVVARTIASNPELAALRNNRRAIDYELDAAKSLAYPRVEIGGNGGVRAGHNVDGLTGPDKFSVSRERASIGATLTQNLYDGGEAYSQVKQQSARVDSARSRVADTANSIALRTVQAYMEVQRAGAVVGIARRNISAHQQIVDRLRTRKNIAGGVEVDEKLAVGRLDATRAFLSEAQATLRDAETMFRAVTGLAPPKLEHVSPPTALMPKSLDRAIAEGKRVAPSVIAALNDVRAAEAVADTTRARMMPRLDGELGARGRFGNYDGRSFQGEATAMLVLRHTLYDSGMTVARINEANARMSEANQTRQNAERIVEREIRFAWSAIQKGRERASSLRRQLGSQREAYNGYLSQFDLGERTLLNILELQNESFVIETTMVTEDFSARYSVFRVLASMGKLLAALNVGLPAEGHYGHEVNIDRLPLVQPMKVIEGPRGTALAPAEQSNIRPTSEP